MVTILVISALFLLEFVGLYFASQNTLTGLAELHRSIRAITQVREIRQLIASQQKLLQKIKSSPTNEDRIVFGAANRQIESFFKVTFSLVEARSEAFRLITDAQRTLALIAEPASQIMQKTGGYRKNILIVDQYVLEVQDQLGKVQMSLADDSDEIFSQIYKARFTPMLVGLTLSLFFLIFALGIGIRMKNRIDQPIQSLVAATKELAGGNLSVRIDVRETNEFGTLSEAFNSMAEKLDETTVSRNYLNLANQELEAFSYSISHDLRAPLRAIDGFSKALLEDAGDTLNEESKSHVSQIIAAVPRMSELIDAVLNLSRISRSEMILGPVDLTAIAHEVAAELIKAEPARNVEFKIQNNLEVTADNTLMRIVLDNLLGNAWKYTSKLPRAEIEFGKNEENGKVVFFVRDNGVGFDMEYAKKLFTPFQRLHSQAEFPGTGVGLASVKRVLHRHGGQVWSEAKLNEGATFYFTFQPG